VFTKYDKAGAAALASAITGVIIVFGWLTAEEGAAVGVLLNVCAVFLVPNAE